MTLHERVPLHARCTLDVGGLARWFVDAQSEEEIISALAWAKARDVPVHVLGGGSNIVCADEGTPGLVLKVSVMGVNLARRDDRVVLSAGAGEPWDPLVALSVREGCAGLECLSGIPGQVGGTPVQNVGAYGQEVAATITDISLVDRENGEKLVWPNADCEFAYRSSRLKTRDANRYIVTRVDFTLRRNGAPTVEYADLREHFAASEVEAPSLADVRDATLTIRRRKGMVIEPGNAFNRSCGSFFVNPILSTEDFEAVRGAANTRNVPGYALDERRVKVPAAWLIERVGFTRGTRRGPVGISPFQAQAIVNLDGARAADVVHLALDIKRAVRHTFDIELVPEPNFIGFTDSSLAAQVGELTALPPH